MATITSSSGVSSILGQYSGIGSDQIDKLIEAESVPKLRAQARVTSIEAQKAAYSDVRSRLSNLMNKLDDLTDASTYTSKKTSSSDDKIATISGDSKSIAGNYDLKVSQLATHTRLIGNKISGDSKKELGLTGTFTINSNKLDSTGVAKTFDFDITAEDSLAMIATKINKKSSESGVAAVIMDGRLVLSNTETGDKALSIVDNTLTDSLGISSSKAQLQQGKDALFNINGIDMTSQSNVVSDKIDGVSITLKQVTSGDTVVHLGLENDNDKILTAVKDFVSQYNSTYSFIGDSLDVGTPKVSTDTSTTKNKQGALVGDSLMVRLQGQLRNQGTANPNHADLRVSQIGISIDKDGVMKLDETKLRKAIEENPNAVQEFFSGKQADATTNSPATTGYADSMKELLNRYLKDSTSENGQVSRGLLKSRTDSFDSLIKDLNNQISRYDDQISAKRTYYVNMFTKLDTALMKAEQQMSYFLSQAGVQTSGK